MIPIETMKQELIQAGWTAKTPTIWKAPDGRLYLGPFQAWRFMKGLAK
jgi:hypothetical protein